MFVDLFVLLLLVALASAGVFAIAVVCTFTYAFHLTVQASTLHVEGKLAVPEPSIDQLEPELEPVEPFRRSPGAPGRAARSTGCSICDRVRAALSRVRSFP